MVWVNFLPWRGRLRQKQLRLWYGFFGFLLLTLAAGIQSACWQHALNRQQTATLKAWDRALDAVTRLQRDTLAARQRLQLLEQRCQRRMVRQREMRIWQGLIRTLQQEIPLSIWLTDLKKQQQSIDIQGFSRDIPALHSFRDALAQQAGIAGVILGNLRREAGGEMHFGLRALLREAELRDEP